MEQKLCVKIIYRNGMMEPVYEKEYEFTDYCDMQREDLLRLITDVEDMVYTASGGKPKEAWDDRTWEVFCKVKHKLQDKAGDIGRLPQNMKEAEQDREEVLEPVTESFFKKVFKRA